MFYINIIQLTYLFIFEKLLLVSTKSYNGLKINRIKIYGRDIDINY